MRIPAASARSPARRITGPSASGSENGKAELDDVGSRLDGRPRERRRLRHRHQVDDERLRSSGRAPRRGPCRRGRRGRRRSARRRRSSARASACDDSSAGTMPSVRQRRWKAASASSSVQVTYSRAAAVAQQRVLRPDAGVVEPGGDRVRVEDLAVVVGEQRRARAVQHAGAARRRATRRRRPRRRSAGRASSGTKSVEHADRVRAAADAGDHRVGQPSLGGEDLLARLAPDHALQLAHELRIRRRADAGADQVVASSRRSRSSRGSPRSSPP